MPRDVGTAKSGRLPDAVRTYLERSADSRSLTPGMTLAKDEPFTHLPATTLNDSELGSSAHGLLPPLLVTDRCMSSTLGWRLESAPSITNISHVSGPYPLSPGLRAL